MLEHFSFGDAVSLLQALGVVVTLAYYAGVQRADMRALKRVVGDHENRLRRVEGVDVPVTHS